MLSLLVEATPSDLLLYCDASRGSYVLATHGAAWRQEFATLDLALHHAQTMVDKETSLAIYKECGELMLRTKIAPKKAATT